MVRIARFAWDESLGPVSQVVSPQGDVWDLPPVDRNAKNPNSDPKKPGKSARERRTNLAQGGAQPDQDRAA